MESTFNIKKIQEQLSKVISTTPVSPKKDEIRYSATSISEFGVKATVYFIFRDGEMLFYDPRNDNY